MIGAGHLQGNRRRAGNLASRLEVIRFVLVVAAMACAGLACARAGAELTSPPAAAAIYSFDSSTAATTPTANTRINAIGTSYPAQELARLPTYASALRRAARGARLPWRRWAEYPKVVEGEGEYAQIGERLYTRHAVDRTMPRGLTTDGRSMSPTNVEHVIQNGTMREETVDGVTRQIYRSGTAQVVTEQNGRIVVTVNPYKYR